MEEKSKAISARASKVARAAYTGITVLAVIATLVEEALVVFSASWDLRSALSSALVVADIVFTVIFSIRMARSYADRGHGLYFRRGDWLLDGAASILPLIFVSGPFLFDAFSGLGDPQSMIALGSFRVLRGLGLLRFLRLLEFFRDSAAGKEAPPRLSRPATAATRALVATLAVFLTAEASSLIEVWPDAHSALAGRRKATLAALCLAPLADEAENIAAIDGDLLLVRSNGRVIYTRFSAEEYRRRFGPDELGYLRGGNGVEAFFSLSGEIRAEAAMTFVAGLSALALLVSIASASGLFAKRGARAGMER